MSSNLFLVLSCYSVNGGVISPWYIKNKNNGIGNMLFQISSGLSYAIKNNATLYVPALEVYFQCEEIEKSKSIFRNINTEKIQEYSENNIERMDDISPFYLLNFPFYSNMTITGYFEDYMNFHEHRELIIKTFSPTTEDIEYILSKYPHIKENNMCSVHVRKGPDYDVIYKKEELKKMEDCTFEQMDYMINVKHISSFFVFTNDKEYCKMIFDNNEKYKQLRFYYSEEKDFIDIWMISMIKYNILSKSTLSWWGSYLNQHPYAFVLGCRENMMYANIRTSGWNYL